MDGDKQGALMEFAFAGPNALYLNSAECFNPSTGQWAEISSMPGRFGDMTDVNIKSSCEIYDLSI